MMHVAACLRTRSGVQVVSSGHISASASFLTPDMSPLASFPHFRSLSSSTFHPRSSGVPPWNMPARGSVRSSRGRILLTTTNSRSKGALAAVWSGEKPGTEQTKP